MEYCTHNILWVAFKATASVPYNRHSLQYDITIASRGTSHGPLSVCLCLSQVGVLLKRLNAGSQTTHDTPGTVVFWCQRSPQNSTGTTRQMQAGLVKIGDFWQITGYISAVMIWWWIWEHISMWQSLLAIHPSVWIWVMVSLADIICGWWFWLRDVFLVLIILTRSTFCAIFCNIVTLEYRVWNYSAVFIFWWIWGHFSQWQSLPVLQDCGLYTLL